MLIMKKWLRSNTFLLFLFCSLAGSSNLHAQAKKTASLPTDEALGALVNKHITTPVQRIVKANGEVFLQRDLNNYFQASLQRSTPMQDHGHNHNDEMLREFLNRPQPSVGTFNNYFNAAAQEFNVPVALLKATAQVQSNWAQVSESMYGSWGVMGLIENRFIQQISLAATLLQVPVDAIKNDAKTNIRAAAALLAHYQQQPANTMEGWFDALVKLTGLTDDAMSRELAQRIYDVVSNGSKTISLWGEIINIDPVDVQLSKAQAEPLADRGNGNQTEAVDYSGAISNFTTCNFNSRPSGYQIKYYFVHYVGTGTYQGAISWFKDCSSSVSAHYVIRNSDGQVSQVVQESNRAWSQGVTEYNDNGIGVEHEAIVTNLSMWDSEDMLRSAAKLTRDVCLRNSIPLVRRVNNGDPGIYGHSDVRATDCPNLTPAQWNNYIINANKTFATVAQPTLYTVSNNGTSDNLSATWKANTEPELVGYRLYYATNDSLNNWALVADENTLTAATTSYSGNPASFLVPPAGDVYHFKLTAVVTNLPNPVTESLSSDTYSRSSNVTGTKVLIVDGFDRYTGSASYKFTRHTFATSYFKALRDKGTLQINSTANEKVEDGTVNLNDYKIVVWFIGDESSADVTLSLAERNAIRTYLDGGGKLIITGSELSYNVSRSGGAQYDLTFTTDYLKGTYVSDGAASYTPATGIAGTPFEGLTLPFGIVYPEDFPDAILATGGAINILDYNAVDRKAGVAYKGTFGSGTVPGGIIYISFPLETMADASLIGFMHKALLYFDEAVTSIAPTALNDVANGQAGAAKIINVLNNDLDNFTPFDLTSIEISAAPAQGTALANADGTITYTGNIGYAGVDVFSYTVKNELGQVSNTATVTITTTAPIACDPNAPDANDAYPKRDLRGAWISTVSNIDWPSSRSLSSAAQQAELIKILDTLNATGINTVFLQIRPEGDALYASTIEPWSYWLTGTQGVAPSPFYDPLQFAIDAAHARGMELHGWINPYRAKQSTPALASNHVAVLHPDWTFVSGTATLLNPGLPAVRDYVTTIVSDIVTRYNLDGIHFDDYFYPYGGMAGQDNQTYIDYNPTGIATIEDWRRDNVNQLIAMVYDTINFTNAATNRNVIFGVSPFGIWKSGVPAGISGTSSYSVNFCDPIAWMAAGKVDYIAPQLYWKITGGQDYDKLSQWWNDQGALYNRPVYPGLALYKMVDANNWANTEIRNQIALNRQASRGQVKGQIFFSAKHITTNAKGIKTALQENEYKHKALTPVYVHKDAVCPNPPQNIRQDADTLRWDAPMAAVDGDVAQKYVVYKFENAAEAASMQNNAAKIYRITYDTKVAVSFTDIGKYFVVSTLDKNNNESSLGVAVVLPITGLEFTVSLQGNKSNLNWKTLSEINTARFVIERSTNGINFNSIATVNAAGNSNTDTRYQEQDVLSATGIYYYRIKIIDNDGQFKYSEIRSVVYRKNANSIVVAPNPFKEVVNFSNVGKAIQVNITDLTGRLLFSKKLNNENNVQLQLSKLPAGMYNAQFVQADGTTTVVKLVKQRN